MSRTSTCLLGAILVASLLIAVAPRAYAAPIDDNLGFKWKSEAPAGYNVTLEEPKNKTLFFPRTTTAAIPVLITANWDTFDPVEIKFLPAQNPDPNSPDPIGRFMISLDIANATETPWSGFKFSIRDDNNTDFFNQQTGAGGSLLHPNRAHFHTDKIREETLVFRKITIEQTFYNSMGVLTTRFPDIDNSQGVYTITLTDDSHLVMPTMTYRPLFYDQDVTIRSLLDIHLMRDSAEAMRQAKFTLILQAMPAAVPEPCDVNGDGQVDINDINAIFAGRNTPASGPNDPRDPDRDGMITVNDARICVNRCTNAHCAP